MRRTVACLTAFLLTLTSAIAQDVVYPGSTVDGDYLRGQGQFLKGAAWFEIEAAKARAIDARTQILVENYLREVYDSYRRERADRLRSKALKTRAAAEAAERAYQARETRLRTNPTEADVASGDALNALLTDLSAPSLTLGYRSTPEVSLPKGVTIPGLAFQFVPRRNAGDAAKPVSRCLIALGKLDKSGGWPVCLQGDAAAKERGDYEEAYRFLIDSCVRGKLDPAVIERFDRAFAGLAMGASKITKERGFQSDAIRQINEMKAAAKIFDSPTIDLAQEMIRDTQAHEAKTAGQLLAFMRKYRLMFAAASKGTASVAHYTGLYGVMAELKEKLGLAKVDLRDFEDDGKAKIKVDDDASGRWLHTAGEDRDNPLVLASGNRITGDDGVQRGTWSQVGNKLILRWPNTDAPGGEWVDTVYLNEDGTRYRGSNAINLPISGVRPR